MEELQRRQTDPETEPFNNTNNGEVIDAPISKERDESDPFTKPTSGGLLAVWKWAIMLPLYFLCKITIPDCR